MAAKDIQVEVAIVGAGSAGLSAYGEVRKVTDSFVVINEGLYGTTCARVGCMPSKVLIQIADDFHRREVFASEGIRGADSLRVDGPAAMRHVRKLRDRFVRGVMGTVESIGERNVRGRAEFVEAGVLRVGERIVRARKIVLASGSRPIIPNAWQAFADRVITSDDIFELEDLPDSVAVIGTGVIGLELGQALHRLGVRTTIFGRSGRMAGLTDPAINGYAKQAFHREVPLHFSRDLEVLERPDGRIDVVWESGSIVVDKVLAAIGRRANADSIGLEKLGLSLDERGLPPFDRETMQVGDLPLFIAGDVNDELPLLHEASDEGKIAGYNCVRPMRRFRRRTPLAITFCDPNIAVVGRRREDLETERVHVGEVTFEGQGRSIVKSKECGLLHVYGDRDTGRLLGAELIAPDGEHIAHELAWAVQRGLDVFEALRLPFYHPVVEEGLRTALRDLAKKVDPDRAGFEMEPLD